MTAKRMRRGAIYARFSSALQKDRSIGDQVALCRELAAREGIDIPEERVYADRAVSGTSTVGRFCLDEMMLAAQQGEFEVVIVEALDRLGRDQEDLHRIRKRFDYYGVEIRSVHEGVMDGVNMTLRGMFAEMFSEQLAKKVKRGHAGLLRDKKIPGAIPYGYRRILGKPGEIEIDPIQKDVVLRIYEEYAAGVSPRTIAANLTRDGIKAPRGAHWAASTLIEGGARRLGLIGNRFYLGEVRWNQTRSVKNPHTKKKVKHDGRAEDLVIFNLPHLRIVTDELHKAANTVRKQRSVQRFPDGKRKRSFIPRNDSVLAGLLRCGQCGSHMVVGQKSRDGNPRMICSNAYKSDDLCKLPQGYTTSYDVVELEKRTFEAMEGDLADPEIFAAYVERYRDKREELARQAKRDEADLKKKLSACIGAIDRYLDLMETGGLPMDQVTARLQKLQAEKVELEQRLASTEEKINVVALHPEAVTRAKETIALLRQRLDDPKGRHEARVRIRSLISHVVIYPTRKRWPYEVVAYTRFGYLFGAQNFPPLQSIKQMADQHGVACTDNVDNQKSVSS
jgi:site-specific DNA recombinase